MLDPKQFNMLGWFDWRIGTCVYQSNFCFNIVQYFSCFLNVESVMGNTVWIIWIHRWIQCNMSYTVLFKSILKSKAKNRFQNLLGWFSSLAPFKILSPIILKTWNKWTYLKQTGKLFKTNIWIEWIYFGSNISICLNGFNMLNLTLRKVGSSMLELFNRT